MNWNARFIVAATKRERPLVDGIVDSKFSGKKRMGALVVVRSSRSTGMILVMVHGWIVARMQNWNVFQLVGVRFTLLNQKSSVRNNKYDGTSVRRRCLHVTSTWCEKPNSPWRSLLTRPPDTIGGNLH